MWRRFALFRKSRSFPKIGGYRICRRLDGGGFGEVFLARDNSRRLVAIKVLKQERVRSPSDVDRFLVEAQHLARLNYKEAPHIVQFEAFGLSGPDKLPYIVMEYVAGGSVRELLKRKGVVTPQDACRIVEGAARGAAWILDVTHGIHRDIKPDNILLDSDQTAKLIDLGIWRKISESSIQPAQSLTGDGVLVGTVPYMAPEIRNGQAKDIGSWSDVYSLGATVYELLTGRLPRFDYDDLYTTPHSITPPSAIQANANIPGELDEVCLKCLSEDYTKRYRTALELADEIGRIAQRLWGVPATASAPEAMNSIPARVAPAGSRIDERAVPSEGLINEAAPHILERAKGWYRRRPGLVKVGAPMLALVLTACVLAGGGVFRARVSPADGVTVEQLLPDQPAADHLDGKKVAGTNAPKLTGVPAPAAAPEPRAPVVFRGHEAKIKYLLFTSDGSRLVSASSNYREWSDGRYRQRDPGKDLSVRVWSIADVREIRVFTFTRADSQGFDLQGIAVSPDGQFVAACTGSHWGAIRGLACPRVHVWDVATSMRKNYFAPVGDRTMRAVAFSPDGKIIFGLRGGAEVNWWSLVDGADRGSIYLEHQAQNEVPFGTTLTPDGRYVVGGLWPKQNCGVRLWDRETGREIRTFWGHVLLPIGVALSPDGTHIVSCGEDHSVRMWETKSGDRLFSLEKLESKVLCVAFSPDGKRFVTGGEDGVIRLRDASTGEELSHIMGHTGKVTCVTFSPKDGRLASGGEDTTIRLWPMP